MNIFTQLYNKFIWKYSYKKRMEDKVREILPQMRKQKPLSKLGAELRLKQQVGKMKHEHKTKQQSKDNQ